MHLKKVDGSIFSIDGIRVTPIRCFHHKLPVYGYRIGDLTYITDTNSIPDEEIDKIRGSKVLIINALRKEPHISHFNLDEALQVIEDVQPEKAYLTHISHAFGKHEDIQMSLPGNVFMAYDGLRIEI